MRLVKVLGTGIILPTINTIGDPIFDPQQRQIMRELVENKAVVNALLTLADLGDQLHLLELQPEGVERNIAIGEIYARAAQAQSRFVSYVVRQYP